MIKSVGQFFRQKTENLSFIELKEGTKIDVNGYEIPPSTPLPIIIDDLVGQIKEGTAENELKINSIIEGMIYLTGADPEFKYAEDYKDILYRYNEDIENYILYRGYKNMEENKLDDALIYFRAISNVNDQKVEGLFSYASALEEKANSLYRIKDVKAGNGFFKESTRYFEEIIELDPSFSLAYYKLGYHYTASKQFRKAEIMWKKFIEFDDNEDRIEEINQKLIEIEDSILYEEGYNKILMGDSKAGLDILLPIKEKYSDWWNLLFMIGLGYRQLGKYIEAKQEFEHVLAISPGQVDTLNELGLCLAFLGQSEEAIEKFTEAIDKRPEDYEIMCNRGMTYLQIGELDKATRDIDKAYRINSEDEITIRCKNEIERLKNME